MKQYLYIFGFCTPEQWQTNQEQGRNDWESCAVFILAQSKQEALNWGREISETLVRQMFKRDGRFAKPPSWKTGNFEHWIEDHPLARLSGLALEILPVVKVGELPNLRL